MPQIEQIQMIYWGALRPDPIDLAVDGINVAVGPNGAGKTTLLDAIKLVLGVQSLKQAAKDYIYHGREDGTGAARRALIKIIFANPERTGRQGRLFTEAGRGCEIEEHVTAICEVPQEGSPRFVMRPGPLLWGVERPLEEDVQSLQQIPRSHWYGIQAWRQLMARVGVSPALAKIISIEQGEASKLIEARTPVDLLVSILDLTGRRQVLDEFGQAKEGLAKARADYLLNRRRLESEERHLQTLTSQVAMHRQFVEQSSRLRRIQELELPLAELIHARRELEAARETIAEAKSQLAELATAIPGHEAELKEVDREAADHQEDLRRAVAKASTIGQTLGELKQSAAVAEAALAKHPEATQGAVVEAEAAAEAAEAEFFHLQREHRDARQQISALESGCAVAPASLAEFRSRLQDEGISTELLAEKADVDGKGVAVEAALGDAVWTLAVDAKHLDQALQLAIESRHRLPIAVVGNGSPEGILRSVSGAEFAGAYLAEIDMSEGALGVDEQGVVRGRYWVQFRAPERPVLGARAREAELTRLRAIIGQLEGKVTTCREDAQRWRSATTELRAALEAQSRLPDLERRLGETEPQQEEAQAQLLALNNRSRQQGIRRGELVNELKHLTTKRDELQTELDSRMRELPGREHRATDLEAPAQAALALEPETRAELEARLEAPETLRREKDLIVQQNENYPDETRSEVILAHHASQATRVTDLRGLVGERSEAVEHLIAQVDRAREAFNLHIRELIMSLNRHFKEICEQAGMKGELDLVALGGEDFGLDVRAAHNSGDPLKSLKSRSHSTGQRAKLSILLLLAALGVDGSADLLLMDEHAAHLDSVNTRYIAEAMTALKDKVQFILAAPSDADSTQLWWCDHQLGFLPREDGQPYAPRVKVMTRMPEQRRRYASMGQLHFIAD